LIPLAGHRWRGEADHEEDVVNTVGIKELRDGLSRYVAEAHAGHTITITSHGRPVARIVPVEGPTTLEKLIAEGIVRPPKQRKRSLPEPLRTKGTVSDLVIGEGR
jgi:prevent-host-death family protein